MKPSRMYLLGLFGGGGLVLPAPTLVSPDDDALLSTTTPTLVFTTDARATSWRVQIGTAGDDFGTPVIDVTFDADDSGVTVDGLEVSYQLQESLEQIGSTGYEWRVRAVAPVFSAWSAVRSFSFIDLLLRVEFSTNAASPITTYEGELGTLALTDSTGLFSVSGGEAITEPSNISVAARDPMWMTATTYEREPGRTLLMRVKRHAGGGSHSPHQGWSINAFPGASQTYGLIFQATHVFSVNALLLGAANNVNVGSFSDETYYDLAVTLRDTGVYCFVNRELLWVGDIGTESDLRGSIFPIAGNRSVYDLDYFYVADVPVLAQDLRSIADAAPADDEAWSGEANSIIDIELTTPETISESLWMYYRWDEGSQNGFRFGIDASDSNRWKVQSLVGGTPTSVISPGTAAATSTAYKLRVKSDGQSHAIFVKTGGAWAQIGVTTTSALYTSQEGMKLEIGAGYSGVQNLEVWPVRQERYDALPNA